jgi:signal transduction histidine kinase
MLRAHGEFVAELVHDLKNPITTIGLFAELGERSAADLRGSRRQPIIDALGHVRAGARRLTDLVGHLGQMTMTGTAASQPPTRTDLVALVQGIVAEQEIVAGGRIRVVVPMSPIYGPWAPISVQRIVGNLLDNAIKYSAPDRAITVALGSEASPLGQVAVLRVRDEGIGIPTQELPYVFDDLYRGAEAHQIAPGSGLGLASVKHLVELHGGTIEIRSAVHQGCEVCVRLPYDAA